MCHTVATNIFSGALVIFADLKIKKGGSKNIKRLSAEYFLVKLGCSFTLQRSGSKQYLKFAASWLNFVHLEL